MPTRDTPWPNGTPCWVDYPTPDMEAARAFYAYVIGWSYLPGASERVTYLTCLTKGQPAAAISSLSDPSAPPQWLTYFATDDAAGVARRITEAGGTVTLEPTPVPPDGARALAADPQGNAFGLWQAGEHIGVRIYNEPGALVWNEAAVDDPAAARGFYTRVFGFRFEPVEAAGDYTVFTIDGNPLGGLGAHQPSGPKGWTTCFSIGSVDAAVAAVEASGGKVIMPAQDTSYGRFAVVEDPWGAAFSMMQTVS